MVIIHKAYNPDEVDGKVRHGFTIQLCWGDEKRKIRRFEWETRYGIVNRDWTTTSLRPKGRALCVTVASPTQSNCQTSATSKGPSGTIPWDAMVWWWQRLYYNYNDKIVLFRSAKSGNAWLACYNNLHGIWFLNVSKIDQSFGDSDS